MSVGLQPLDVTCAVCRAEPDTPCVGLAKDDVHLGRANYAALVSCFPQFAAPYIQEKLAAKERGE